MVRVRIYFEILDENFGSKFRKIESGHLLQKQKFSRLLFLVTVRERFLPALFRSPKIPETRLTMAD